MERGDISVAATVRTAFVFEELIAHLQYPRRERAALRTHKYKVALEQWSFDFQVCDYMGDLTARFGVPVLVITWHSDGFAEALHDRLWRFEVPVAETRSWDYLTASPHIATDLSVDVVYDANPDHRFGYGWKCRQFDQRL